MNNLKDIQQEYVELFKTLTKEEQNKTLKIIKNLNDKKGNKRRCKNNE